MQCNFIFRAQELDLGRLATAFALLRLPGMPELARVHSLPSFTTSPVDPNTVKVPHARLLLLQQACRDRIAEALVCAAYACSADTAAATESRLMHELLALCIYLMWQCMLELDHCCCSSRTRQGRRSAKRGLLREP